MIIDSMDKIQMSDSQVNPANTHYNIHRDLNKHIILYDASCTLCTTTVAFLQSKIKNNVLNFYPLKSEMATIIFKYYISVPACDSVILIRKLNNNQWEYFTKSDALLHSAGLLVFPWSLFKFMAIFPKKVRDIVYELIARYRYTLFGKTVKCNLCHD